MLIDLHAHSYLSKDCKLDPRAVLERAAQFGLDGVAFTETNTQDGCDELLELGARSKVRVFVGLELVTDRGQYLCFFPKPEAAPEPVMLWGSNRDKPWSAAEALPKLRSLGAAIVAARPYDREFPGCPGDAVKALGPGVLCAVEGFNPKVRQLQNDLAVEAAAALGLPCTGGSDARASLDELGRGATFFKRDVTGQADLVKALLEGGYWPAMATELPRLTRPGEAQAAAAGRRAGGARKGMRKGGPRRRQ